MSDIEFNINEINPIQLHDRATEEAKKAPKKSGDMYRIRL